MIGHYLGKYPIVNLMCQHSVARKKSRLLRRLFSVIGPMAIKLVGYPFNRFARARAKEVVRHLKPEAGDKILDFGCGIGCYVMEFALNYTCTCVGVDIDEEDIGLANKIKSLLKLGNVDFFTHIDHSRYGGYFDKIISSEVLEHIDDDKGTLEKFSAMLKPDGKCVLTVPLTSDPIEYGKPNPQYWNHVRSGYSLDSFKSRMAGTDFLIDEFKICCNKRSLLLVLRKNGRQLSHPPLENVG